MTVASLDLLIAGWNLDVVAIYEKFVTAYAIKQYPAEPHAHAYLIELYAQKGEPIDAAARAARAAIAENRRRRRGVGRHNEGSRRQQHHPLDNTCCRITGAPRRGLVAGGRSTQDEAGA